MPAPAPHPLEGHPTVMNLLSALRATETGAAAVEYGLIVCLVAVAVIGVVGAFGTEVAQWFESSSTAVTAPKWRATPLKRTAHPFADATGWAAKVSCGRVCTDMTGAPEVRSRLPLSRGGARPGRRYHPLA